MDDKIHIHTHSYIYIYIFLFSLSFLERKVQKKRKMRSLCIGDGVLLLLLFSPALHNLRPRTHDTAIET